MVALTLLGGCMQDAFLPAESASWNPSHWHATLQAHSAVSDSSIASYESTSLTYYDATQTYDVSDLEFENERVRLRTLSLWDYQHQTREEQGVYDGRTVEVVENDEYSAATFEFDTENGQNCYLYLERSARLFESGADWRYAYRTNFPHNVYDSDLYGCWDEYPVKDAIEGLNRLFAVF